MKHTKGTWEIKTPNNSNQTIESEFGTICTIASPFGTDEAEANAKLIAAAPELLNFIKEYVILVSMEDTNYSDYEKFSDIAKALIQKATNE